MSRAFSLFSHAVRIRAGKRAVTARASQPEAISWTVQGMTNEGNPSMANAIRKRVALASAVAVAAGLLSALPAQAAAGGTLSFTSITPVRAVSGQNATLTLRTGTSTASAIASRDAIKVDVISAPASGAVTVGTASAIGAATTPAAVYGDTNTIAANTALTLGVQATVAGTYQLAIFEDVVTSNNVLDPTEPFVIVNFTTTGAPTSIVVTAPATTPTATNGSFTVVARDASGNATQLGAGEWVAVASTAATVASADAVLDAADFASGEAAAAVQNANAGTASVTFTPSGLFSGAAVTSTLTTAAYQSATALLVTSTAGVGGALASGEYGSVVTAASGTAINASTVTGRSITFRVSSAAAGNVIVTVGKTGSTAVPAGITEGTIIVATSGTSPTGSFTLTTTAPVTGSTYTVTAGSLSYVVTYDAPTINSTKGTVTLNPASSASARTLVGGTASLTATVADAFGDAFSGANVVFTVTGRNTYTASVLTNASGVASYSIVDASTSTSALTDTVNVTAQAPTAANASSAVSTTFTYVTSVSANSLTLTSNASTTATNLTDTDATVTLTATARNAAGAGIQGIPVTFTLPTGAYLVTASSNIVYTNSSGIATLDIAGTRVGANAASAAAGGQTATHSFSLENVAGAPTASPVTNGDARVIALAAATASMPGGATAKITATVTDRYGNPVSGVTVSVSYSGTAGRVAAVNGIIGSTGVTNASGQIVVDVTAAANEVGTGTLVVSFAGGDASTSAAMGNGAAYTARVTSASLTATITAAVDANATAIARVQEQVTALAASVTTLIAALSAQVKRLQTALTNLRKLVRSL